MSRLRFVTIDGVTQKTSVEELLRAHEIYSGVEWAVCLSSFETPGCVTLDKLPKLARQLRSVSDLLYLSISVPNELVNLFLDFKNFKEQTLVSEIFSRIHLEVEETENNREVIENLASLLAKYRIQLSTKNACSQWSRHGNREILFSDIPDKNVVSQIGYEHRMKIGFHVDCSHQELSLIIPRLNEITRIDQRNALPFWVHLGKVAMTAEGTLDFNVVQSYLRTIRDTTLPVTIGKKSISKLTLLEIDWWMGSVEGYSMVPLSHDASAAVYLHRLSGKYCQTHVGTSWGDAGHLLQEYRISVIELVTGEWQGAYLDKSNGQTIFLAKSRNYLRAAILSIIMQNVGRSVPLYQSTD